MQNTIQFHEAVIQVAVKIIDGDHVVDVKRFQIAVLMDTDAEWQNAIALIREQLAAMEVETNGYSGNAETSESA